MNEIELKPASVFECFAKVNQVPRPSKKEEQMIQFLLDFGKRRDRQCNHSQACHTRYGRT